MTTKQLRSNHSGVVSNIIGETDDHYWVQHQSEQDRDQVRVPFTVLKSDRSWSVYRPLPEVGDIWSSTASSDYRVIGVDKKGGMYFIVRADAWFDGGWPELRSDQVQHEDCPDPQVFVRELPEGSLTLTSRRP